MFLQFIKFLTVFFFILCGITESKPASENELMEVMKICLNNKAEVF